MNAPGPWRARSTAHVPWFSVGDDDVRLLRDGALAFPAMLEAIAHANHEILLEIYWIGVDTVGETFRDALAAKARQGATVRVIYDSIGSFGVPASFWHALLEAGGEVRAYHPLLVLPTSLDLTPFDERDHRKLLVVDKRVGFTGGLNLALPWLPQEDGGDGWRDDMLEVRGPVASELRTLFYKTWRRAAGHALGGPVTNIHGARDLVPLGRRPRRPVYVLASLRRSRRNLRREYLSRINHATKTIAIANSYFVPDRAVRAALFRAVARGVRVRVLLPGKSDVAIVQFAVEARYDLLLRRGIELYGYVGPMMHAKTAVIDDSFVTIGSYNLDERSRRKNLEVNLAVRDAAFATHVRTWFDHDLAQAERIDLYAWRARPLVRRGLEYVAYALRKFW